MKKIKVYFFFLYFILCFLNILYSNICYSANNSYESINNLQDIVTSFVKQSAEIDAGDKLKIVIRPHDLPRFLASCQTNIEASLPSNATNNAINSVLLSCSQAENSWQAIIPVHLSVSTQIMVAKKNIPAGRVIQSDDLSVSYFDRDSLYNGYFKDVESAAGLMAARIITTGSPITVNNTERQLLVHHGEDVSLEVEAHGINVTMKGVAKSDGKLNQTVQVMNTQSKKVVDAIVVGMGKVRIVI